MRSIYAVYAALVLFAVALTFTVLRGESTRHELRVVQHGPAVACVRKHDEGACRKLARALEPFRGPGRDTGSKGSTGVHRQSEGVVPGTAPSGGGPTGRVPSPGSPPPDQPDEPAPEPDAPALDLDVPLPVQTCVDGLLGVNC